MRYFYKVFISSLIGVLIILSSFAYAQLTEQQRIKQKIEKHAVKIFSLTGPQFGKCSGVVIGETKNSSNILTAKHCLSVSEEFYVEDKKVRYIISSPKDDLAILVTNGRIEDKTPVILAKEKAKNDDEIYHASYPRRGLYTADGLITRTTDDWQYAALPTMGGCSGGGMFNKDGELIGILWGGIIMDSTSIFEPITDIKAFLESLRKPKTCQNH